MDAWEALPFLDRWATQLRGLHDAVQVALQQTQEVRAQVIALEARRDALQSEADRLEGERDEHSRAAASSAGRAVRAAEEAQAEVARVRGEAEAEVAELKDALAAERDRLAADLEAARTRHRDEVRRMLHERDGVAAEIKKASDTLAEIRGKLSLALGGAA